jgi:hypothetical protein
VVDDYTNNVSTSGVLTIGGQVTGSIEIATDEDWFAVTFAVGQQYLIGLDATATGGLSDPYLTLYSANGVMVTTDDDSGPGLGSLITYRADANATYYVAASSGTYGAKTGNYTVSIRSVVDDYTNNVSTSGVLTIGGQVTGSIEIATDEDWFKVAVQAGSTYSIELLGASGGGGTLPSGVGRQPYLRLFDTNGLYLTAVYNGGTGGDPKLSFTAAATGTYYVSASDLYDTGTGTYTLKATSQGGITDDYAGSTLTRGTVSIGSTANGALEFDGDQDWFAVTFAVGQQYLIGLDATATGGLRDPY